MEKSCRKISITWIFKIYDGLRMLISGCHKDSDNPNANLSLTVLTLLTLLNLTNPNRYSWPLQHASTDQHFSLEAYCIGSGCYKAMWICMCHTSLLLYFLCIINVLYLLPFGIINY